MKRELLFIEQLLWDLEHNDEGDIVPIVPIDKVASESLRHFIETINEHNHIVDFEFAFMKAFGVKPKELIIEIKKIKAETEDRNLRMNHYREKFKAFVRQVIVSNPQKLKQADEKYQKFLESESKKPKDKQSWLYKEIILHRKRASN
jgi:hypothetical protein